MKLFAKQIVNDLKPFRGLWLFAECRFSPLQGERYFRSNRQGCSKNLSLTSLKNTCEGVDFLKLQARNLLLYKKWGNSQVFFKDFSCTLCWQLYRQPFSSIFSHFQHFLWHQKYFGMDYLPFLDLPPLLCLTHPLIIKFFQPTHF